MEIEIKCSFDQIVPLNELVNHPKNPNKHSKEQIERLSKLFTYHGIRLPIIVSKHSGFIVSGHGRKQAAIKSGMTSFPVSFQNFEDDDHEYAFMVADNAIADWAELDLSEINMEIQNIGPFDIDMLGLKNFALDPSDLGFDPDAEDEKKAKELVFMVCPHCEKQFEKGQASVIQNP